MSPEKKDTRIRKILAQKLRLLRFTRGWSQEAWRCCTGAAVVMVNIDVAIGKHMPQGRLPC